MEDLSIRGKEIEKLKSQLKNLQELKLKIDNVYVLVLQKAHRLNKRIKVLENEYVMAQTMAPTKEKFCAKINEAMTEILPSIEIIFEHKEFVYKSKEVIKRIK